MFVVDGRLDTALGRYEKSIQQVGIFGQAGAKMAVPEMVRIELTRVVGHERLGLIRVAMGEPELAQRELRQSKIALDLSVGGIKELSHAEAAIVEKIRLEAPARWQRVAVARPSQPVDFAQVELGLASKLCEHGCMSRSGFCRGHPPDPCL